MYLHPIVRLVWVTRVSVQRYANLHSGTSWYNAKQVCKRNSERYDLVVFGASGFTGQFVVDEVARVEADDKLTWAVAGRNTNKLSSVLEAASQRTGKQLTGTPIIISDATNEQSVLDMCRQAKVIVNCVGPYRFYGDSVVKACIEAGTHHVDFSGEPQFLERTQLLYSQAAKEAGLYVVGSCGSTLLTEMGIIHTQKEFQGDINSVEIFIDFHPGVDGTVINFPTYECAVYGYENRGELHKIRRSLFNSPLPKWRHGMRHRSALSYCAEVGRYILPYPGSDQSVVIRTQRYNYEVKQQRPIQTSCYFCRPSFSYALTMAFYGVLFDALTKSGFGRALLLKFPRLFTCGMVRRGGPSEKQVNDATFSTTFIASGYSKKNDDLDLHPRETPDKTVITTVLGPEIAYVATSISVVHSVIVILKEADKLPLRGGVFTPGVAFADTTLIHRLHKRNIVFRLKKGNQVAV